MITDTLRRLGVFMALCLAQALVLNRIQLFHCATPLLYVYFTIMLPRRYPRWAALLWSFALGLAVDVFSNTPGLAAASMTLTGLLQPYVLEMFLPREADENIRSAAATLGWGRFASMAALLTTAYCAVFFSLEAFSLSDGLHWAMCVAGSTVLTLVLLFTLETLRK